MKKRLTQSQEFEIMKLVLDKFLWLGFGIMIFGLYKILTDTFANGLMLILIGIVVLVIFLIMIVREYEFIK